MPYSVSNRGHRSCRVCSQQGIIHSDLAARQFLLDNGLHVKISDFGFSSFSDGDVLGFENSSHQLPRDLDGDMPSTVQSDLFALGSTLYEVITRRRPYEGLPDSPNHRSLAGGGRHRGPIENHVTYQGRPFKVSV